MRRRDVEVSAATSLSEVMTADRDRRGPERAPDAAASATWDVIAGASHDLRNPITSIGLMIDAIADGLVDAATARRYYEQIRKQLGAMTVLTDDLVMISKVNGQQLPRARQIVDVDGLIDGALQAMSPGADQCGVELEAAVASSVGQVLITASADHLLRVLLNLIANAIRHSPPSGTVVVAVTGREQLLRLEVTDSGPGISLGEREHVFKPYASSGAGSARPGQAGLGLAICRALLQRHDGRIWIGPSLRGARVCVEIPN